MKATFMRRFFYLVYYIFFTFFCITMAITCNKDNENKSIPSCYPQTEWHHEIIGLKTILLKEKPEDNSIISYILINDDSAVLIELSGMLTVYNICNFPQYAQMWEIPKNGLTVILSGKAYLPSKICPADRSCFDLDLLTLKRK